MDRSADTPNGEMSQAGRPAPRGVVIMVWGMGIAILVMTALLILGLTLGWHKKGDAVQPPDPTAQAASPAAASGPVAPIEVITAPDSRLYTIAGDGSRVALHVAAPTGDEIIVIDTSANRIVSRIRLKPEGGVVGTPR